MINMGQATAVQLKSHKAYITLSEYDSIMCGHHVPSCIIEPDAHGQLVLILDHVYHIPEINCYSTDDYSSYSGINQLMLLHAAILHNEGGKILLQVYMQTY